MRKFNLEEAKAGKPVVTRDGRDVRIVCFDRVHKYPIIAIIKESNQSEKYFGCYTEKGSMQGSLGCDSDLFMAPVKKEGWANIFKLHDGTLAIGREIYETKADAIYKEERQGIESTVDTIKIEWEE